MTSTPPPQSSTFKYLYSYVTDLVHWAAVQVHVDAATSGRPQEG